MPRFWNTHAIQCITLSLVLVGCGNSPSEPIPPSEPDPLAALNLPATMYNYSQVAYPTHYLDNGLGGPNQLSISASDNTPASNPVTNAGATLGRVLFYDTELSANGTVSCASCHQQEHGFSDPRQLSVGFEGGLTRRHSMSLANATYYQPGRFFWDERAATLEDQVLQPIQDPVEMGTSLAELITIVSSQDYYPVLFEDAFGDPLVSTGRISRALAQYVRSLVSVTSRYDIARAEVNNPLDPFPDFSALENQGKFLFMAGENQGGAGCNRCHTTEAFINGPQGPTNNGLDAVSTDDLGAFETTPVPRNLGAFKVPSLKNIAVTAPYMHDGRFNTLQEVMEHYSTGIQDHQNLGPNLLNNDGSSQNFTANEIAAFIAFLETLTDTPMLSDEKFSDPFR